MENHLKQGGKFANLKIQAGKPTPSSASVFPQQQRPMTSQSNQSLPLLLEINANFEEYSRYFKDPLPPLSLVDPLSYYELITLSRNLGSILKLVKLLEKDTSNKVNDLKRVNDKYLVDIEKENRDLKQQNRNLKEELDQILTQKNKPTPLNFYKTGVNFKTPISKSVFDFEEEIQLLKIQLKSNQEEVARLNQIIKEKDQPILQGSTSNIQNPQAAQVKQETTEIELELRRLKDKLDDRKDKIRSLTLEVQKEKDEKEDIKKKLKKMSSVFNKNQDELLTTRDELAKLQNYKQFLDKQHEEAVQLYSKQKTEEIPKVENEFKSIIKNLENSVFQKTEDFKRQEEIIQTQQSEIHDLANKLKATQQQIKTLCLLYDEMENEHKPHKYKRKFEEFIEKIKSENEEVKEENEEGRKRKIN